VIFNIIFGTAVLGVVMGVAGDYAHTKASVMLEKKMARSQQNIKTEMSQAALLGSTGTGNHRVDARMQKKYGGDQSKWTDEAIARECRHVLMGKFWKDQLYSFLTGIGILVPTLFFWGFSHYFLVEGSGSQDMCQDMGHPNPSIYPCFWIIV
jgi:hypothetical protein